MLAYSSTIEEFTPVIQDYKGQNYQTVGVHRLPHRHPIERHIVHTMMSFNKEYFNYDLYGTFEIQFLKYTRGSHYDWHCDYGVSENPNGPRKLSMSIQLSSCWEYNGGDVLIRDWHNRTSYMSKEVGNVMVFDSRVPHKVEPLKNGERLAIVAWAHGPELR